MNNKKLLVSAGACLLFSAAAGASAQSERNLPLWEVLAGAGGVTTPAYPGADDRSSRALALPFLIYRGPILRSDQSGIGARLLRTDKVEFDIGFAASLPASSEDVAARRGMRDLGTLVEFGPRIKFKIADLDERSRVRFEVPLRAVIEGRGGLRHQGWTLEPRLLYERREADGLWTFDAQLAAVFGDRAINRYFYEVRPIEATAIRPAYQADPGLILLRTGLFASRKLNPDLRFFGFVRFESYAGSANHDSPLHKRDTGVSAGFGFAWTLAHSKARASD